MISHPDQDSSNRERDLSFLVKATRLLADSLDVETTLATVARLSLPHLGSWCMVDLLEGDHMRRLAIVHPDPTKQALAERRDAGREHGEFRGLFFLLRLRVFA